MGKGKATAATPSKTADRPQGMTNSKSARQRAILSQEVTNVVQTQAARKTNDEGVGNSVELERNTH